MTRHQTVENSGYFRLLLFRSPDARKIGKPQPAVHFSCRLTFSQAVHRIIRVYSPNLEVKLFGLFILYEKRLLRSLVSEFNILATRCIEMKLKRSSLLNVCLLLLLLLIPPLPPSTSAV